MLPQVCLVYARIISPSLICVAFPPLVRGNILMLLGALMEAYPAALLGQSNGLKTTLLSTLKEEMSKVGPSLDPSRVCDAPVLFSDMSPMLLSRTSHVP